MKKEWQKPTITTCENQNATKEQKAEWNRMVEDLQRREQTDGAEQNQGCRGRRQSR